ncbi:MAG: glycosyltransferase family 9 protein [Dissulfurispiraceae bacterium]
MSLNTFIYHDGALGDLLLSLAAIKKIRACSGAIHLAGRGDAVDLLRRVGWVDDVSSVDSPAFLSLHTPQVDQKARNFISGFNRVVVFTVQRDSWFVKNIRLIAPLAQVILAIPPERARESVAEFRLRQLTERLELAVASDGLKDGVDKSRPILEMPPIYKQRALELMVRSGCDRKRPLIAIHPGSGGKRKCWPIEKYFSLMKWLKVDYDPFFVIFSGPADEWIALQIEEFVKNYMNLSIHVCNEDLMMVASLLSLSDIYVGNDSGITHLASAVNGNVIVIFGPTDPLRWKPLGNKVRVINSDSVCAPCGDERSRKCWEPKCLLNLPVERIYKEIKSMIDHSQRAD